MRFIIILLIIYIAYRALKSWLFPNASLGKKGFGKRAGEIDDVMVKDPYCEVYFAKRNGVHLEVDGKDLYFCSTECRDKFIESRSGKNS